MKRKSEFRKLYLKRLIFRLTIFFIMILLYIFYPNTYEITKGINIIKKFSSLHIIWLIWLVDIILQLCKVPKYWPLGSQKYWASRYLPNIKEIDKKIVKKYMQVINKDVIAIAITWTLVIVLISVLYFTKTITYQVVILCSAFFYVCDIICIIGWCPFKTLYMHNKCCTTCRIFNWDHAMMFTHLIIIPGIWTYSLVATSLIVLIVWEVTCALHPERFLEKTNNALHCHNCKDKLCGKLVNS